MPARTCACLPGMVSWIYDVFCFFFNHRGAAAPLTIPGPGSATPHTYRPRCTLSTLGTEEDVEVRLPNSAAVATRRQATGTAVDASIFAARRTRPPPGSDPIRVDRRPNEIGQSGRWTTPEPTLAGSGGASARIGGGQQQARDDGPPATPEVGYIEHRRTSAVGQQQSCRWWCVLVSGDGSGHRRNYARSAAGGGRLLGLRFAGRTLARGEPRRLRKLVDVTQIGTNTCAVKILDVGSCWRKPGGTQYPVRGFPEDLTDRGGTGPLLSTRVDSFSK